MQGQKLRVSTKVGRLTLRDRPDISGNVIDEAAPGDTLEVFTANTSGPWVRVRYKDRLGWMWAEHVVTDARSSPVFDPHEPPSAPRPASFDPGKLSFWLLCVSGAILVAALVYLFTWLLG